MQQYVLTPYEGKEPYIFVSYAHKDAAVVYPIVEELNRRGYRVWYDDGLAPGNEWPEEIARHLAGCHLTISMISPRYIASDNCRRELTFALSKRKSFLAVFLEPTELSLGLEMQLSAQLCVLKYNYADEPAFYKKLCSCPDIGICCMSEETDVAFGNQDGLNDSDRFVAAAKTMTNEIEYAFATKRKRPYFISVLIVALLAGIFIAPRMVDRLRDDISYQYRADGNQNQVESDSEIPIVLGNDSNLEYYHIITDDNDDTIEITGVWGEQEHELNHLVIPESINGSLVRVISEYAFNGCRGLKAITLPDSVTEIRASAFNACVDLEQAVLPNEISEIADSTFRACTNLKRITIPDGVTSLASKSFQMSGLEEVVLPDSVIYIGYDAYENCENLQKVVLPNSVATIDARAFSRCLALEQVVLPGALSFIGDSAFEYCQSLRDIVLPDTLNEIQYRTFYECTALETIRIPRSVKSIGNEAFFNCVSLTDVYYEGTEQEWEQLMSQIDWNYSDTLPLQNNMALRNAEIHFNA